MADTNNQTFDLNSLTNSLNNLATNINNINKNFQDFDGILKTFYVFMTNIRDREKEEEGKKAKGINIEKSFSVFFKQRELDEKYIHILKNKINVERESLNLFKKREDLFEKFLNNLIKKTEVNFNRVSSTLGEYLTSIYRLFGGLVINPILRLVKGAYDIGKFISGGWKDLFKNKDEEVKKAQIESRDILKKIYSIVDPKQVKDKKITLEGIKNFFTGFFNGIKTGFNFLINGIKNLSIKFWEGLKSLPGAILNGLKNLPGAILGGLKGLWKGVVNVTKGVIAGTTNIFKGIGGLFKTIFSGIGGAFKGLLKAFGPVILMALKYLLIGTLIIAGITMLILGFFMLKYELGKVGKSIMNPLKGIEIAFKIVISIIKGIFNITFVALTGIVKFLTALFKGDIKGMLKALFVDIVWGLLKAVFKLIVDIFKNSIFGTLFKKKVGDAIITKTGEVIETSEKDNIVATKKDISGAIIGSKESENMIKKETSKIGLMITAALASSLLLGPLGGIGIGALLGGFGISALMGNKAAFSPVGSSIRDKRIDILYFKSMNRRLGVLIEINAKILKVLIDSSNYEIKAKEEKSGGLLNIQFGSKTKETAPISPNSYVSLIDTGDLLEGLY